VIAPVHALGESPRVVWVVGDPDRVVGYSQKLSVRDLRDDEVVSFPSLTYLSRSASPGDRQARWRSSVADRCLEHAQRQGARAYVDTEPYGRATLELIYDPH